MAQVKKALAVGCAINNGFKNLLVLAVWTSWILLNFRIIVAGVE